MSIIFRLPENCSAEEALAACIAYEEAEQAYLLAAYPPCPDDDCPDFPGDPTEWGPLPSDDDTAVFFPPAKVEPDPLPDDEWVIPDFPDHGAPVEDPEPFEPAPNDRAWLAPRDIADEIEDAQDAARWAERIEEMHHGRVIRVGGPITDADVATVGGAG